LHKHPYVEVAFVIEGSARIKVGDEEREVQAGGIAVIPANTPHQFINSGDGVLRQIDIRAFTCFANCYTEFCSPTGRGITPHDSTLNVECQGLRASSRTFVSAARSFVLCSLSLAAPAHATIISYEVLPHIVRFDDCILVRIRG